jgi:hypothetical protein
MQREALNGRWVEYASTSKYFYSKGAPFLWPHRFDSLPTVLMWEHNTEESFRELIRHLDVERAKQAYVQFIFENVKAFAFMQFLKTGQLLDATVALLNQENVLGASACARSALEATAAMTDVVHRAQCALRDHDDEEKTYEALAEVGDYVGKCLWGGRAAGSPFPSVSVITQLQRLVKRTDDEDSKEMLLAIYEQLCDVVHPSATGHKIFWTAPTSFGDKGPLVIELTAERVNDSAAQIGELVLWAIGWSSAWAVRSWENSALPSESW